MTRQYHHRLKVSTSGADFTEITTDVAQWLRDIGAGGGLLTVFIRHTSASLTIQENADPDVLIDLGSMLRKFAPEQEGYRHCNEGPDDMPAHIKSMLTATSLSIPVLDGALVFGTWQGLFVMEHRTKPHNREIVLHFLSDGA